MTDSGSLGTPSTTCLPFADSHCHLDFPPFDADRPAVLDRARQAGVGTLILIGCSAQADLRDRARQLAAATPGMHLVSGVHPHEAGGYGPAAEAWLRQAHAQGDLVGLGELGFDFYYDLARPEEQRHAFSRQLGLARELDLPVVLHTRDADAQTAALLRAEGVPRAGGVVHCFSGGEALRDTALELGLHLGVTGMVTYPWAAPLRAVLREVPPSRLTARRGAPYLAPAPRRLPRNEPGQIPRIAEKLAEILELDVATLARLTTASTHALFRVAPLV